MTAVAWTAIGLLGATLAALMGSIFRLGARIDAVGRDLGARIDAQTARIDSLSGRIDAHLERHAR